jgi:SAM-dependent methyltransferase
MITNKILQNVERYYSQRIETYGPTAKGVDWNSIESQMLRFEQLLKVCDPSRPFSIIDYGCGYGALVEVLLDKGYLFEYQGFDVSDRMISEAAEMCKDLDNCRFVTDESLLATADYLVASGIFNVKLETPDEEWLDYLLSVLTKIDSLSKKGFAFNTLTKYSDKKYMRSDLYYADPCHLFDYCKTRFSRHVAILHDYGLYEFTVIVRKCDH